MIGRLVSAESVLAVATPYVTGAGAGLVARALSLVAGFANLWLLTQMLSKEQFAGYVFVLALLTWLAMVGTAGLDRTILYRLARADAPTGELVGGPLVAAALMIVLPVSVAVALAVLFGTSAGGLDQPRGVAFWSAVLAPVVVMMCVGRVFEAWFWARGRVAESIIVPATGEVARTAGLLVAFFLVPTVTGVATGVIVASFVPLLVWSAIAPLGRLRHTAWFDRGDVSYGLKAMLGKAANEGTHQLDVIMIGILAAGAAIADYAVAARLAALVAVVKGLLTPVLTPRLARYSAAGRRNALLREYGQVRLVGFLAALVLALLFAAFGRQVLGVFGDYEQSYSVLILLIAGFVVSAGFGSNASFLIITGHAGWTLAARMALLAAIVALNLVLVPRLGAFGAALSMAIGMAAVNVVLCVMIWQLDRLPTISGRLAVLVGAAYTMLLLGGFEVVGGAVVAAGLGVLAGALVVWEWPLWLPAAKQLAGAATGGRPVD